MQEVHLENILARYPDVIEDGLVLLERQKTVRNKRIDLVFSDSKRRKLVVEVKAGTLGRTDIGQLSEYCHYLFELDGARPRGMLIGTQVPDELRGAAGFNGFECLCLTLRLLEQAMIQRGDQEMLGLLRSSTSLQKSYTPIMMSDAQRHAPTSLLRRPSTPPLDLKSRSGKISTIADMLRSVLAEVPSGTLLKADQIISAVLTAYPGATSEGSILVADKCYNITNAGLSANHDFRIFEYVDRATYRYVGEGYPYSGYVTWKGVRCGLWTKGVLTKWDNWPYSGLGRAARHCG